MKALKVDVEGHEPSVFEGASALLAKHKVYYILMEYFPRLITIGHSKEVVSIAHLNGTVISTCACASALYA